MLTELPGDKRSETELLSGKSPSVFSARFHNGGLKMEQDPNERLDHQMFWIFVACAAGLLIWAILA
jgi:hypothetical protein